MNSLPRSFELTLSRGNIVDQVAQLLYPLGVISHNEEVTNIQFSDLFGVNDTELCKLTVHVKPIAQYIKPTEVN